MDQEKILEVAVSTGTNLLRFGAETYRVEDTINRICKSYGLKCDVFAFSIFPKYFLWYPVWQPIKQCRVW